MTSILVVGGGPATGPGLLASTLGAGHDIREASSADEALRLARAERPALIVADPLMAGHELLGKLRADEATSDIPHPVHQRRRRRGGPRV